MQFEIFNAFLRLGLIGFGGPLALVAMIEQEVSAKRQWLTKEQFAEIFAVCKLLPGPLAVQVAICCGYQRGGRRGGLIAGLAFLLPALILITLLAIAYQQKLNTSAPLLVYLFKFMQDATLAIILVSTFELAQVYVRKWGALLLCGLAVLIIYQEPGVEPLLIIASGCLGLIIRRATSSRWQQLPLVAGVKLAPLTIDYPSLIYTKLLKLFWVCIKAGEFSFGTGLAIIPLLHGDLVSNYHWLTEHQFLDGVTLGQITPGPTTVSIVFFGYLSAGVSGLIVATLGFYIPPLVNALLIIPVFWRKLAGSLSLRVFTSWAFQVVIGGILSAFLKLSLAAVTSYLDGVLVLLAILILRFRLLPLWGLIPLFAGWGLVYGYCH